jgi:hypothetical protein
LSVLTVALILGVGALAEAESPAGEKTVTTPEMIVTQLYDEVTFEAGSSPDWESVRGLFVPEAVIVLRTSREGTTVFTLDGFVEDFVKFIESGNVSERGFRESIVKMHTQTYGDIAQAQVLFEAKIPGSERPPQRGIDVFQLSKREEGWRIVAITNEIVWPDKDLPSELQE